MPNTEPQDLLYAKLNLETAPIGWKELQRFFATGVVFAISHDVDMVQIAVDISQDNRAAVETWLNTAALARVSDAQALQWFETDATLWSVVVKPWILVQELPKSSQKTVQ